MPRMQDINMLLELVASLFYSKNRMRVFLIICFCLSLVFTAPVPSKAPPVPRLPAWLMGNSNGVPKSQAARKILGCQHFCLRSRGCFRFSFDSKRQACMCSLCFAWSGCAACTVVGLLLRGSRGVKALHVNSASDWIFVPKSCLTAGGRNKKQLSPIVCIFWIKIFSSLLNCIFFLCWKRLNSWEISHVRR